MSRLCMLAAVDRNWGIGYDGDLLFHLKQDMVSFREKTVGNVVVMGRKTLESLPGGKPLFGRTNIVLTKNNRFDREHRLENLIVLHSVEEVLEYAEKEESQMYIIGGSEIYRQFVTIATEAVITKVDAERQADTYFPNLDEMSSWEQIHQSEIVREKNGPDFRFVTYRRIPTE